MASNEGFFKTLRGFFNITLGKPNALSKDTIPLPGVRDQDTGKMKAVKFPGELQKLWDWWLSEVHDSQESLKGRMDRYKDLDFMYYNNTVVSMAIDLYADETVQSDSQMQVLEIKAKERKVEKYIEEFFQRIGVTQKVLRSTAFDIALYGDHFWVISSDAEKGIKQIIPIDVYSLTDRIEFNLIDAAKKMKQRTKFFKTVNRDSRMKILTDILENKAGDDYSQYFMKYLFGYQIEEDLFLPPWSLLHFRRFSTKSEFYPFGRPLLINSIAPFRQLQASKNLVAMARAAKFPKERFQVQVDENMTEIEQWQAVNEARQEYQNLGVQQTGKEEFAIGAQIWLPTGLIDYDMIENNLDVGEIGDLEMLRDDLILGTRIPKGYLIVDRASFGTSGQALLQQFKPFGRAVFSNQSVVLEELVHLVKLQWAMTGDYPVDTDFEITMAFPVIEESSDRLRLKGDTLRLAKDVLDNIQSALGLSRDVVMPPDVMKSIFSKLSFIDTEDLDYWVDEIVKAQPKPTEGEDEDFKYEATNKKIKDRLSEEVIKEAYFHSKRNLKIEEGVAMKRHFMSSFVSDPSKDLMIQICSAGSLKKKSLREDDTGEEDDTEQG